MWGKGEESQVGNGVVGKKQLGVVIRVAENIFRRYNKKEYCRNRGENMGFFNFVKKIVRKYKNMNFVLDNQEIDNKSVEETGKKQEIEKETIDILVTNDIENCVCTTETSEIAEEENDCDGNSVEIGYEIPGNKFIKG